MSEPRDSLRRRRQYAPNEPERKILRKLASTMILLNILTLQALREHDKSNRPETFHQLIGDHSDKIEQEFPYSMTPQSRITRHVRSLSVQETYQIALKPIDSQYYRDAIHLRIGQYEISKFEDTNGEFEDSGAPEAARDSLLELVKTSQTLYQHVKEAAMGGYLEKNIDSLRAKVESIDDEIEYACSFLAIKHQPLVYSDNNDQTEVPDQPVDNSSSNPVASKKPPKGRSTFALLVPTISFLSAIPAIWALTQAEKKKPGNVPDPEFFQVLSSGLIQLLGISTAFVPILNDFRPDRAARIQAWTLATLSLCLTVAAVPLYPLVSAPWSGMSLFAGTFVQSFLQLQLILGLPGLRNQTGWVYDREKKEL